MSEGRTAIEILGGKVAGIERLHLSEAGEVQLDGELPGNVFEGEIEDSTNLNLAKQTEDSIDMDSAKRAGNFAGLSDGNAVLSRSLIAIQKISPTPPQYPRKAGVPAKRPIK